MSMVKDVRQIPVSYRLSQNYPNPFNSSTTIQYAIPSREQRAEGKEKGLNSELYALRATLKIYNILGQEVRTLVDAVQDPGYYSVTWEGRDERGQEVSTGVYFCRITVNDFSETKTLLMLK
jgi:flagellar hook assembly protein FlgD